MRFKKKKKGPVQGRTASEVKYFPGFLKAIDDEKGIVEHFFAVMGNIDDGGDVLERGAFKKTISEQSGRIRVLDHHNTFSVLDVLGKPLEIREVGRDDLPAGMLEAFPDATGAVFARTQFFLDTPEGKGAFLRIKHGGVNEWSFGYDAVDTDTRSVGDGRDKQKVRVLKQVRLYEYSPVLWGMNPATRTLGAKSATIRFQKKMVMPFLDLPYAPLAEEWDEAAQIENLRAYAGDLESVELDV